MSFLVDDGDQQATLELALAFIDADAGGAHTSATDSSGDELWTERESGDPMSLRVVIHKVPSALAPSPPLSSVGHVQALSPAAMLFSEPKSSSNGGLPCSLGTITPSPGANPKTARAASLKKHRERKKAVMQSLRDQVAELEAQLAHLRLVALPQLKPHDTSPPLPLAVLSFLLDARSQLQQAAAAGVSWADIAAAQANERFRSEALNQTLRDALQRQAQMSDTVRGILGSSERLSEVRGPRLAWFAALGERVQGERVTCVCVTAGHDIAAGATEPPIAEHTGSSATDSADAATVRQPAANVRRNDVCDWPAERGGLDGRGVLYDAREGEGRARQQVH